MVRIVCGVVWGVFLLAILGGVAHAADVRSPATQAWIAELQASPDDRVASRAEEIAAEFASILKPYESIEMTPDVRAEVERRARAEAIRRVVEGRGPAGETPAQAPAAGPTHAAAETYVELPIVGEIGTDVRGGAVASAIQFLRQQGIRHVVLRVDTPGGVVEDALVMQKAIVDNSDAITFHALVDRAISAGIWPVLACDTITTTGAGSIGGAVAFTADRTTGAIEVDAKMNSILASELAAVAEAHGRSALLVKAMMLMDATVFAWREGGATQIAAALPAGVPEGDVLLRDGADTVLTLTPQEAIALGLARPYDPQAFPPTGPEQPPVAKAAIDGPRLLAGAHRRLRVEAPRGTGGDLVKLLERRSELVDALSRAVAAANAADPSGGSYTVYTGGKMTDASQRLWRDRSDQAVKAWRDVMTVLDRLEKAEADAVGAGAPPLSTERPLAEIRQLAAQRAEEIYGDRNRSRM